jgi:hypothetical protein
MFSHCEASPALETAMSVGIDLDRRALFAQALSARPRRLDAHSTHSTLVPSFAHYLARQTKEAAGAYHLVPFQDAGAVFSLDTATNEMTLHAIHAELVDGGQLQGSGKMNVSPAAEFDPSALDIVVRGSDINQEAIAKRFIPDVILPMELDTVGTCC